MGAKASKPPAPPPDSVNISSENKPITKSSNDETDQSKPPSDALLRLAMGAKEIEKPSDTKGGQDRPGSGSIDTVNGSPLKSLMQQSILGEQLPVASSMLPDVSYSMRDSPSHVATQNPVDGLDQAINVGSIRKNTGAQNAQVLPRQGSNVNAAQIASIPLQQPQIARAPGWVAGMPPRGRGSPIPTGYRAPQGPNVPMPRGSLPSAQGRGYPVHIVVSGDRNIIQQQQSGDPNLKARKVESSSSDGDEDSDEDIEKEDEDVEDWDLGDEAITVVLTPTAKSPRSNSPAKMTVGASQVQQSSNSNLKSESQKTEQGAANPPVSLPRRRSSGFQPKFRPALDLSDDIENVESDSNDSSDASEDVGESDDYVHDWLDGPVDLPPQSPVRRVVSPAKPITPLMSAREGLQASPAQSPSRHVHGLTIVPPASGSPTRITSGLTPGRTPQPPSYRQGNMSPTRSAGASLSMSPAKQGSYRSGIVNNLAPAVVPLVMAGDMSPSKSAPSPSGSPAASAIRDTKVVKKKKAELPQHNLPHPVPKFGDWLNSRTMINNYIILEPLGVGGYAEVKLCKEKQSGKLFAMKFISRDVMKKDKLGKQSKLDDIKREIAIMKKLNHPNVLRLYEVMDDPKMNKLFLVLEYMKHGDMLSFQKKKNPQGTLENLRDRDLHSVFLQVILGLAYLHEQKIVHGDIKPQNLLVGDKDVVKIADFGISQSLYGSKQKITDVAGTPAFMSPEMCSGEEFSGQLADVWALGATIFMLKFGNPPFLAKSAMHMFERIQNDPLVFPAAIDPLLAHLLNGMLTKSTQKRLTLLDVMVHPWVTKNEKHNLATNRPSRPISVSKDEIEHAVGANHVAIVVNIRKQMHKRLKTARENLEAKKKTTTDWENSNIVFAQSPKSIKAKNFARTNKICAVTSDDVVSDERKVLSSEETDYRSQLFSRKKASNKNTLEVLPPSEDHAEPHVHSMNDSLDDEELISDDDDLAVSQSPQLLDELLLTTLSMPPLASITNSNGSSGNASKLSTSTVSCIDNRASWGRNTGSSDDLRFDGESPTLAVRYGVSSLQGRRSTQEDRWVVFPSITTTLGNTLWADTAYVGIYDGHGGEECANILHEQLHNWIFKAPNAALTVKDLQDSFESLDASVCDYLLHKDDLSGSTATGLILRPGVNRNILLTIAHVGDCRLVLGKRDGDTVELTQDHRLTLEAERERVIQLGGRVVNNRVNGVMAITRAFGDLEFKGMLDQPQANAGSSGFGRAFRDNEKVPPLLTAKPDVHELALNPKDDAFLLLACDGLWDVLTSEEATAIFRERVELHGDLQLAAHELAQEGIRRYSNDNITVIAVLLQPP
ncbi:CAMKK/CAMKK-META protein kinase [Phytophthora nicotianae]|uniref:CAMKK/CAMKK-META protein kinase n=2 Tax=Phytophthora nicotianae TaxID=4792 RepID=V9EAL5_PHYNI|nr:CAMKK/CAMKK-META protein kinase [Phytophthora nicotianae P1569]ETM36270.1 CAMKK/CAMKK-META protein kinase [Phytophthora nicotianae]